MNIYFYVFFSYLILNIFDWITGSIKAAKFKKLSSDKGIKGLLKKLCYWLIILISFGFSSIFTFLSNEIMDIDLSIIFLLGWFTFASLFISEVISILENLISLNIKVPSILFRLIRLTEKIIEQKEFEITSSKDDIKDNTKLN